MPCILIVDDLKENIELVSDTLTAYRPEISLLKAQGGLEALRQVEERETGIDLLILDANMPDLDGFSVCERIKANSVTKDIPVLMLSGVHTASTDRLKGLSSGADSYLCKPYHPEELVAQVSVLLKLKEMQDQLDRVTSIQHIDESGNGKRTNQTSFKTLFNAAPDAMFVESEAGIVLDVNPAACELQGMSRQELVGRSVFDLVPQEHKEETRTQFNGWFDGTLTKIESETQMPDGTILPVEITGRTMELDGQKVVLLQVRDISRRRILEQQVRSAQKMDAVGRLAGGVAHDFNNILTSVLGYSHIVLESEGLDQEQRDDLLQVINSANRAADLTRQLMVFGRRQLQPVHPVNMNAILRDIDPLLRRTIGTQIEVVCLLDEDLAAINSDESHLEQIIINLSVNAMDAMPRGGQLTLQTYNQHLEELPEAAPPELQAGDYAVLEISDTGTGIPEAELEHIFEPFFSTKEPGAGVGLGLSTVFGIVRHSNGFVEVESNPGEGTCFRIYFPASEDPVLKQEIMSQVHLTGGDETLLVVEDESLVRHLTVRQLSDLGYTIISAPNGSEALRVMDEHDGKVDMVITDIIMPHMGGPEMVTRMRETHPDFKVLFISGYGDHAFSLGKMAESSNVLLTKPFTKQHLAQRIRELLEQT